MGRSANTEQIIPMITTYDSLRVMEDALWHSLIAEFELRYAASAHYVHEPFSLGFTITSEGEDALGTAGVQNEAQPLPIHTRCEGRS
jgi:hypothetical protein